MIGARVREGAVMEQPGESDRQPDPQQDVVPDPQPDVVPDPGQFDPGPVVVLPESAPWPPPSPEPVFVPPPPPKPKDPVAVAVANASLLGVGYLMLGRRLLWLLTALVTAALVVLLVVVTRSGWLELALLLWWAAMIWHGWRLARPGEVVRTQRVVTLAWVVPLLLVVGLVRFDAVRIEWTVDDARAAGDCAKAKPALDKVWIGHRVVDAPMAARTDQTVLACRRLDDANGQLTRALASGGVPALDEAFTGLGSVLAELPGHEKMVDAALGQFLGKLPVENPCHTSAITNWLKERKASGNGLDRAADVAPRLGPAALVGCGDRNMGLTAYREARESYQRLLDAYPGHELTGKAEEGVKQATLAMELAHVRGMGQGYCAHPAQYSGAAPYGKGVNRAIVYGSEYTDKLPGDWKTTNVTEAVLIVCTGEPEFGPVQETCPYVSRKSGRNANVAFHRISVQVRAYELRTAKLVFDEKVTIGGASCPSVFMAPDDGSGPPSDRYVDPSEADMRKAFAPAIAP